MGALSLAFRKGAAVGAKAILPAPVIASLKRRKWLGGGLRTLEPTSRCFGLDRGQPIDRYYIENFLAAHTADIRDRVLEIGDDIYTRRFGGNRVGHSDVLHVHQGNPRATIVSDLACGDDIPSDTFDCIICTQTLMFIYDVRAAVATMHRILKPGGVALVTMAGISQVCRWDMDQWGDYWRFTTMAAQRLFGDTFGPECVQVDWRGNVLASVAFLHGLAAAELKPHELDHKDRDYQMLITVRARRN